jgi:hypothetical protein
MTYKLTHPGERGRVTDVYAAEEIVELGAIPLATTFGRAVPNLRPISAVTRIVAPAPATMTRTVAVSATAPRQIAPEVKPDLPSRDLQIEKAKTAAYSAAVKTGTVVRHPDTGEPVITLPPTLPPALTSEVKTAPLPDPCIKTAPPPPAPVPPPETFHILTEESLSPPTSPGFGLSRGALIGIGLVGLVGLGLWIWSNR